MDGIIANEVDPSLCRTEDVNFITMDGVDFSETI